MFIGTKSFLLLKNLVETRFSLNWNSLIFEIIFEIKKAKKDISGILERSRKEKIFWKQNPRIVCLVLVKKKSIERNFRSLNIYYFYRIKLVELFFWLNNFKFSKNFLNHYFSKLEFKFLNIYNQILNDYFSQIQNNLLLKDKFFNFKGFFSEIFVKKNIEFFFKKEKKKLFS